jgi:ribulose-phosphate 3-epimerase
MPAPVHSSPVQYKIAPSLLAADFARLREELATIERRADSIHLDVMDGHFVPNLTFGMPVIGALRPHSGLVFDCHIMTTNPTAYLEQLREVGADIVTVHLEAVPDPSADAVRARELGLGFGVVISPGTPFEAMEPFVEECTMVVIMSVHPGFGGQSFMPEVLPKVEQARKWVDSHGLAVDIQVDGGITVETAPSARDAGANVFVAGTAVFGEPDRCQAIEALRKVIEGER